MAKWQQSVKCLSIRQKLQNSKGYAESPESASIGVQWNLSNRTLRERDTALKFISHTMDKTKSPNFIPPINTMRLESLKRGQSL